MVGGLNVGRDPRGRGGCKGPKSLKEGRRLRECRKEGHLLCRQPARGVSGSLKWWLQMKAHRNSLEGLGNLKLHGVCQGATGGLHHCTRNVHRVMKQVASSEIFPHFCDYPQAVFLGRGFMILFWILWSVFRAGVL